MLLERLDTAADEAICHSFHCESLLTDPTHQLRYLETLCVCWLIIPSSTPGRPLPCHHWQLWLVVVYIKPFLFPILVGAWQIILEIFLYDLLSNLDPRCSDYCHIVLAGLRLHPEQFAEQLKGKLRKDAHMDTCRTPFGFRWTNCRP
jgi:hypothetical protein